jgi:hypothetical protein
MGINLPFSLLICFSLGHTIFFFSFPHSWFFYFFCYLTYLSGASSLFLLFTFYPSSLFPSSWYNLSSFFFNFSFFPWYFFLSPPFSLSRLVPSFPWISYHPIWIGSSPSSAASILRWRGRGFLRSDQTFRSKYRLYKILNRLVGFSVRLLSGKNESLRRKQ